MGCSVSSAFNFMNDGAWKNYVRFYGSMFLSGVTWYIVMSQNALLTHEDRYWSHVVKFFAIGLSASYAIYDSIDSLVTGNVFASSFSNYALEYGFGWQWGYQIATLISNVQAKSTAEESPSDSTEVEPRSKEKVLENWVHGEVHGFLQVLLFCLFAVYIVAHYYKIFLATKGLHKGDAWKVIQNCRDHSWRFFTVGSKKYERCETNGDERWDRKMEPEHWKRMPKDMAVMSIDDPRVNPWCKGGCEVLTRSCDQPIKTLCNPYEDNDVIPYGSLVRDYCPVSCPRIPELSP